MSNLLALDQASRISGWSFFQDGKLIDYGKIEAKDDSIGDRLFYLRQEIISLIDKYEINEIIFEDIQLQKNVLNNVQTFKVLAEVIGMITELCVEFEIPYQAVLAATWKSFLSIKGADRPQQKRNAQEYILKKYNIKATQDECDALCIGTYAINNSNKINTDGFDWSN